MKHGVSKMILSAALAAGVCACVGFAGSHHDSSMRKTRVIFSQTMKFANGVELPAGEYRMEVPANSQTPNVQFFKIYTGVYNTQTEVEGKAAASVNATVVSEPTKNARTEVVGDTQGDVQVVKSIQPKGWNEQLVFAPQG
jgi:hypothetical protein